MAVAFAAPMPVTVMAVVAVLRDAHVRAHLVLRGLGLGDGGAPEHHGGGQAADQKLGHAWCPQGRAPGPILEQIPASP
jgi:hypothetical protein